MQQPSDPLVWISDAALEGNWKIIDLDCRSIYSHQQAQCMRLFPWCLYMASYVKGIFSDSCNLFYDMNLYTAIRLTTGLHIV